MKPSQASATAEIIALARAMENFRPARVRLFEDPYSFHFLRPEFAAVALLSGIPLFNRPLLNYIDGTWPGLRTSGVARTRLIDDYLKDSILEGFPQVVIIGSGYDCRAYRLKGIKKCRVFEVDYPATLARKKRIVKRIFGKLPRHVVYAAADFNKRALDEVLERAGFDFAAPAFFIWEGVIHYLTEKAVEDTFEFIGAQTAAGSRIVFTYVHRAVIDKDGTFGETKNIGEKLKEIGETWTYGIRPEELGSLMEKHNLELIEDMGSVDYRTKYLGAGGNNLKGFEFYRASLASVKN
jgi:methyltransferase (TIGR00027 family)